jgi:hypothetical protein
MSHTFEVDSTTVNEQMADYDLLERAEFVEHWKGKEGETLHHSGTITVPGYKAPLFDSISKAFNQHYPLVLTPDSVWLTILAGLVHHIDTDPEGLRHHFVQHEGQVELVVKGFGTRDTVKHDWDEYFIPQFTHQLKDYIGKKADLILCDFSTTTYIDRISSMVALMGAMKHYFAYKSVLLCGLSKVTIGGTPEDWSNIGDRVQALSEFGLKWWTDPLSTVICQLELACEGHPDVDFWRGIYLQHRYGSGGQHNVSGWVNAFYPYISGESPVRNKCVDWEGGHGDVDPQDFFSGMVFAPVKLDDNGTEYDLKFFGGLVGSSLDEELNVRPVSGFAIQDVTESESHD